MTTRTIAWNKLRDLRVLDEVYEKTEDGFAVIRVVEHFGAFPIRYRLADYTQEPDFFDEIPCLAVKRVWRGENHWVDLDDRSDGSAGQGRGPMRLYFCPKCRNYRPQGECHSIKLGADGTVDWENGTYQTCCSYHHDAHPVVVEVKSPALKRFYYDTWSYTDMCARRDMWYRDRIRELERRLPPEEIARIDAECERLHLERLKEEKRLRNREERSKEMRRRSDVDS